jgi:hypothetical protein
MTRPEQAAALRSIRRESVKYADILPAGRRVALEREALAEIVNVLTGTRYLENWKGRNS